MLSSKVKQRAQDILRKKEKLEKHLNHTNIFYDRNAGGYLNRRHMYGNNRDRRDEARRI